MDSLRAWELAKGDIDRELKTMDSLRARELEEGY